MGPSLFICYPRALLTSISLPMEMIAAATSVARIKRAENRHWQCHIVAAHSNAKEPIEFAKGLNILPSYDLSNSPQPQTIFLPPIWGKPDVIVDKSPQLVDWLLQQHESGAQICATGTGVCLLAQAGLLDGKVATTHWYYFDEFENKYPDVSLQRHHFITQAGRLFCCGSINALVDLTVYFIESYFGKDVSQVIEQHFSHEINRTYDKPWYSTGTSRHPDEGIIEVQQWMQSHYSQEFNLKALAELANMSVRNFSRRFKVAVGKSALAYGADLKMQAARDLLKKTNLSHQDIADQVGFKDAAYFSRQFKLKNKITPKEYREMVRGKLFNL
ncbi:GlxA family transcriptional regulator [Aliikangiella coralliicola]|uniref:Helix-turn-helix domain-containing protein n=1 Tax=Aliikangiella coralliicola TaxID=2592383 RepID=A0A545U6E0_9GAMM|nr:helix-turn-helix domain-containing protein [Aliikangiella coralliicola]TQV85039.1 helix-turn-helix domain-containing protein [Aliikangiella coralliicola]